MAMNDERPRVDCFDCKHNRGGKCLLHPYGKTNPVSGYINHRPGSQINYDGHCREFEKQNHVLWGIVIAITLIGTVALAIYCQNL